MVRQRADDRFRRLDELVRELKEWGVHLLDVGTLTVEVFDGDDDVVEVTADVRGVVVKAWYDGYDVDRDLRLYTEDQGFVDFDEIGDADDIDDDLLCGLVDEVENLWKRHGYAGLADYRAHLRSGS